MVILPVFVSWLSAFASVHTVKPTTPCPLSKSAAVEVINRAEGLRQSGSYVSARSLLEEARPCVLEGHVAYAALSNNLAQIYKVIGPKHEVEKLLRSAVNAWRGSPYYARGLANLGDWYQSRKDWRRAEQLFREAVTLQPELAIHYNNLGWLLHKRGRLDEAERHYRRALELYEGTGDSAAMQAWGNLGMLLEHRKRDDEAMAAFQRMREFSPVPADEKAQAIYLEAYAYLLRRRQDSAEAERVSAQAMRYRVRSAIRLSVLETKP